MQLWKHDLRRGMPRFIGAELETNYGLVKECQAIADDNGCTMAQLSLAWLLAKDDGMVPIPGTKHQKYVEEKAAAADLRISARDLELAGEIINQHTVAGARYAESQMISLDPEE